MGLRSRKPRRTILVTNLILPREIEKEKEICSEFNHKEPRNFLRLELEMTGEEMSLEKRVFKKNNLIRPGNRKTRMLFC